MSFNIGNAKIGGLYLGSTKISEAYLGSVKVYSAGMPALAPKSMRFDFKYDHWNPVEELPEVSGMSWTHVSGDVYDFHCDGTNWTYRERNNESIFDHYSYQNPSTGKTAYYMTQHQFDVLDMDLTGVTSVAFLFHGAQKIQNIFSIRNTSSLTDTSNMFYHQSRIPIKSVPLFDTSSVTNMSSMFENCFKLASVPLFDTSSCTTMSRMLMTCGSLRSVPLFDTSSCTTMSNMLNGCSNIEALPLFDTSSCTNMDRLAYGCTKVETGALALYQQASTQETGVQSHQDTFKNCGSYTDQSAPIHDELAQIPTSWGGTMA